jgi:uncharacterized protein (DUF433 family)
MTLVDTLTALPLPLRMDLHGTIRVGGTRVTLDTVVHAFDNGATPEQIVIDFDCLSLADVYAVVSYYLQHREQVREYLAAQEAAGEASHREYEARYPTAEVRERILARHSGRPRSRKEAGLEHDQV